MTTIYLHRRTRKRFMDVVFTCQVEKNTARSLKHSIICNQMDSDNDYQLANYPWKWSLAYYFQSHMNVFQIFISNKWWPERTKTGLQRGRFSLLRISATFIPCDQRWYGCSLSLQLLTERLFLRCHCSNATSAIGFIWCIRDYSSSNFNSTCTESSVTTLKVC